MKGHDLHTQCQMWTIACRERNTLVCRTAFEVFQPCEQLTTEQVICEHEILCEFALRLN